MKQEPLQNLKQRTVRCLLAILALLTMPAGMWAEDYNLWVAGVHVTSDNAANVMNDETPRVVFNASTNTLTLNQYDEESVQAPSYEGAFIKNGLSNLTINLVGFNRVHGLSQSSFLAKNDAVTGECTATFTTDLNADEPGSIDIYTSSLSNDHTIYYDGLAWTKNNDSDKGDYFSFTSNFRLSVGGAILCDSNGAALEIGSFGSTVTFNTDNNTLTLDGATVNGNVVVSGAMSALNIKVKGQNVINAGNQSAIKSYTTQSATLSFTKEGTGDCSLQLNSDDNTVISTGFTEPTYTELALVVEDENMNPEYYSNRGLYHYAYPNYYPITSATITSYTTYGITVSGEAVTSVNMNSILKGTVGVGHISFDGVHTLTLNKVPNYVLNGSYPFIQTSMDLTINLVGNNEFDCGQSIFITRMEGDNDTHTVTFTTDENNAGTLILTVGNVFDGFEAVYQNGLIRDPDDYYEPTDNNKPAMWIAQESLGLKVEGIVVTQGNSSDILGTGYGSVSYNSTTNTLTLKGATIDSPSEDAIVIGEDIEALTVHLVGYNQIGSQDHYVFNLQGNTALTFTTSETMPGSINSYGNILYANQQALATYENGLALNADNNEMKAETGTMNVVYLTGFVSYVNSDNGGSAYIYTNNTGFEATAAELKNNAVIVSTPEGSTQTEMWSSLDASTLEKFTFQFDWGSCTNKNVKVQVVGYNQNEEEPYDWVADGKTYSDEISLSTADGDGIVEIPLTSDVTSGQVRLKFSSDAAFSFVALNIGIKQAATYPLTIAGTTVTGKNAEDVLGNEKVSYDAETNTLTLNGTTIDYSDREGSCVVYSGSDDLTIKIIGDNTIITQYNCEPILYDAMSSTPPSLKFERGSQPCSLHLQTSGNTTVIKNFNEVIGVNGIGDATGNFLALSDGSVSYSASTGLYTGENVVTSVTITSGYGIVVAGVLISDGNKDNVLNDELETHAVTFTPAVAATETPAILTLSNAAFGTADANQDIVSSLSNLTIHLDGNNTIRGSIVSTNEEATLTITAGEGGRLDVKSESPISGFSSTPTLMNDLVYLSNASYVRIKKLDAPTFSPDGTSVFLNSTDLYDDEGEDLSGATIKYSITYPGDETPSDTFIYNSQAGVSVEGPLTINAWVESNSNAENRSATATAINFGFTEPMKVVYEGEDFELTDMPDIVPTLEGVRYVVGESSNSEVVEFKPESSTCTVKGVGTTNLSVYLIIGNEYDGPDFTMLNEVAQLTVNVIPPLYVAPIADITYTGSPVTPTIVVKATEEAEAALTAGTDYVVSGYKQGENDITADDLVDVGTYTVVITGIGNYAGTKEVAFNITQATPIITFAQESYSAILGETFTSPETVDNWTVTPTASSNTSVATVSDGLITLVGVGTTTITVTYAETANYNSTTASYQLVVSRALDVAFVGSNSWASYYATENLAVPQGLTAYIVSDVNETSGVVTVQTVGYIPANNGVLLQREANGAASGYVAAPYTGTTSTFNNLLAGSAEATNVSSLNGSPVYVLFNDKFKRATSGTIPARRAYLPLAVASAGAPQLMTLNVMDGISTGISTLAADDNDGIWYTIDGLKLSGKPQHKGLYIKNGKKVFFNNK